MDNGYFGTNIILHAGFRQLISLISFHRLHLISEPVHLVEFCQVFKSCLQNVSICKNRTILFCTSKLSIQIFVLLWRSFFYLFNTNIGPGKTGNYTKAVRLRCSLRQSTKWLDVLLLHWHTSTSHCSLFNSNTSFHTRALLDMRFHQSIHKTM